jgi:hypothetical protein
MLSTMRDMDASVEAPALAGRARRLLLVPAAVLASAAFAQGPAAETREEAPALPAVQRGLGLWLTDYSPAYLDAALERLVANAEIAYGQYEDPFDGPDAQVRNRIVDLFLDRAAAAGLRKYVALEPLDAERRKLRVPADWKGAAPGFDDGRWQAAYRERVRAIVERHRPEYLNLAVEINLYRHYNPEGFGEFAAFYRRLRDEVKGLSPETRVFCSYVYSTLRGEYPRGAKPQWDLLDGRELPMDVLGISAYPLFLNDPYDPLKIPADYFEPLTRSETPVFFAEIGWYSSPDVRPASSPGRQAQFVARLPKLLRGVPVEGLCWISLADLQDRPELAALKRQWPQFFSLGLLDAKLVSKPAWSAWQELPHAEVGKRAPVPEEEVPLDSLVGFGGTRSARLRSVAEGEGERKNRVVEWAYDFQREPPPLLAVLWPRLREDSTGLRLRLRAEADADIIAVAELSGEKKFEQRIAVKAGPWQDVSLPWSGFKSAPEAKALDAWTEVERLSLVDVSAYGGRQGSNTVRIDRVQYLNQTGEQKP